MSGLWESIEQQAGTIKLPGGIATLHVPETSYYLNPANTRKVLVEIWDNPPGNYDGSLFGMLFPADTTPFANDAWGVVIEYSEDGYVTGDDTDNIDYHDLLSQMKQTPVLTAKCGRSRVMTL
ncbi:MAG: DUF2167 domain-containing protein [Parahaliea sp.]